MKGTYAKYTIQKRDFSSQLCPFCHGKEKKWADMDSTLAIRYYSFTYPAEFCLNVPRCKHCAGYNRPTKKIALVFSLFGAVSGFLLLMHVNMLLACVMGVTAMLAMSLLSYIFMELAFNLAYKQSAHVYDVVRIIKDKYKWTTVKPDADVDFSKAPPKEVFDKEFAKMLEECGCEIVENRN